MNDFTVSIYPKLYHLPGEWGRNYILALTEYGCKCIWNCKTLVCHSQFFRYRTQIVFQEKKNLITVPGPTFQSSWREIHKCNKNISTTKKNLPCCFHWEIELSTDSKEIKLWHIFFIINRKHISYHFQWYSTLSSLPWTVGSWKHIFNCKPKNIFPSLL